MSTPKKETKLHKRMPPNGKVLRRLTGRVTCTDRIDKDGPHRWRITLFPRRSDEVYLDVPKKTLVALGIRRKGQVVELIRAKAPGKTARTILRPVKERKISKREMKKLEAEAERFVNEHPEF